MGSICEFIENKILATCSSDFKRNGALEKTYRAKFRKGLYASSRINASLGKRALYTAHNNNELSLILNMEISILPEGAAQGKCAEKNGSIKYLFFFFLQTLRPGIRTILLDK